MSPRKNIDLVKVGMNEEFGNPAADPPANPTTDTAARLQWPEQFAAAGPATCGPRLHVLRVDP